MPQTLSSCNPTTCQSTSQPTQREAGEPQGTFLGPQNRGEEGGEGRASLSEGGEKAPAYCGSIQLESLTARMHLCISVCNIHTHSQTNPFLMERLPGLCNCLSRNILYNEEKMFHSCKNKHISVSYVFHMATGSLCFNLSQLIFIFQQQKHTIIEGLSLLAFLLEQIICIKIDLTYNGFASDISWWLCWRSSEVFPATRAGSRRSGLPQERGDDFWAERAFYYSHLLSMLSSCRAFKYKLSSKKENI